MAIVPQLPAGHLDDCACSTCAALRNAWPGPAVEPTPAFDVAWQTKDYVQRIHWWVRLFGIVWIVIPVVATLTAIAFGVGAISMARVRSDVPSSSSSYIKCLDSGSYTVSECVRMYPD